MTESVGPRAPYRALLCSEQLRAATETAAYFTALPWHTDLLDYALGEEYRPDLQVPTTSIYSRPDGIVPWRTCVDIPGARRESIEVHASHLGMGVHPAVLSIVLDRLRQPVGAWRPYDSSERAAA